MRLPRRQCCPRCDHTFKTQTGSSYLDIQTRKEKILSTPFIDTEEALSWVQQVKQYLKLYHR